jgi:hypothetical protein
MQLDHGQDGQVRDLLDEISLCIDKHTDALYRSQFCRLLLLQDARDKCDSTGINLPRAGGEDEAQIIGSQDEGRPGVTGAGQPADFDPNPILLAFHYIPFKQTS